MVEGHVVVISSRWSCSPSPPPRLASLAQPRRVEPITLRCYWLHMLLHPVFESREEMWTRRCIKKVKHILAQPEDPNPNLLGWMSPGRPPSTSGLVPDLIAAQDHQPTKGRPASTLAPATPVPSPKPYAAPRRAAPLASSHGGRQEQAHLQGQEGRQEEDVSPRAPYSSTPIRSADAKSLILWRAPAE
jgi:hypothetical protein